MVYPLPEITDTYEEALRYGHVDIPDLDSFSIRQELMRVRIRLAFEGSETNPWLVEREAALEAAMES